MYLSFLYLVIAVLPRNTNVVANCFLLRTFLNMGYLYSEIHLFSILFLSSLHDYM